MGKTAFSGPVYGAKGTLFSVHRAVVSSGVSSQVIASIAVPAYEEWFLTEIIASASSGTTGAMGANLLANSSAVPGSTATITSTETATVAEITRSEGEFEGFRVLSSQTIEVIADTGGSSVAAIGNMNVTVRGFTRWIPSTRAE